MRDPTGFRNRIVASSPHRLRLQLLMCLNNSVCQLPSASGATEVCSSSLPRTGPERAEPQRFCHPPLAFVQKSGRLTGLCDRGRTSRTVEVGVTEAVPILRRRRKICPIGSFREWENGKETRFLSKKTKTLTWCFRCLIFAN